MARVDYVVARPEDNRLRRALLDDLLECAHDRKIAHVAFRMPSGDPELVQAAEARGFRLMTTFVGFSRTPSPGQADPAVREARRSDVGPVCAIAREVFSEKTRFHHDSTLSPDRSTEFYVEWTRKCLAGEGADVTLVARDGGRVGGFITGRVLPESGPLLGVRLGTIDMFAVGRRFQGRGLGKMLLDRVLDWFWRQRVGTAQVGTEGFNFPALGLYTSAGFRITRSALTFHRRL
ncbi:MAG: GNAT family N-acetyltransferase [Halobacteria archaeon]